MFPTVTLVMLLYKSSHLKDQIARTLAMFDHVVLVDNDSRDGLLQDLEQDFPEAVSICSDRNLGFGAGNNLGLREVKTEYCLVANPDALFDSIAVENALAAHQSYDRVGVVGGRIIGQNSVEKASIDWDYEPRYSRPFAPLEGHVCAKWVYGCFMLFNTQAVRQAGLFDERFFLYYEEWDVCKRLTSQGFQVLGIPDVNVHHIDGRSSPLTFRTRFRREYHWLRSKRLFLRKFPNPHYREKPRLLLIFHGFLATTLAALFFRKNQFIKGLARMTVGLQER